MRQRGRKETIMPLYEVYISSVSMPIYTRKRVSFMRERSLASIFLLSLSSGKTCFHDFKQVFTEHKLPPCWKDNMV